MTQVITGHAAPTDAKTYRLVPFEMPEGVSKLSVRYQFGEEIHKGSGIIDIGVFDARGAEFLSEGFRGWSGSARREFFITPESATPGYMPGALMAGTWNICLGLYEIDPHGCGYQVEIDFEYGEIHNGASPALLPLSTTPRPENRKADGWYKGELHCHTYNSDGDSDPLDVIQLAEQFNLDFLAITDHNVLTQQIAMRSAETPLMLIPGMEVTTYRGHWNVWGEHGWLDFRVLEEDDMRRSMEEALKRGYLVSCNHPKQFGPPWEYPLVENYHCVEVWNGPWQIFNDEALDFWENHLRAGKRYSAVGGSDSHFLKREHIAKLGHPTTFIYCEGDPSPAKLLDSLKAGHAFITDSPDGPQIYLSCGEAMVGEEVQASLSTSFTVNVRNGEGCTLQLVGQQGILIEEKVPSADWQHAWEIPSEKTSYVRAQLLTPTLEIRALTNPIYLVLE